MMAGASRVEERAIPFEVSEDVDLDEWQAIADASPSATFFHTPTWFRIFARSDPNARIRTRLYRFEDGRKAVFPLLERRRIGGLYTTTESSPVSCYGGWITADPLTPDHAAAIARSIIGSSSNLIWRINPLDPLGEILERFATCSDTTEILGLTEFEDVDSLRAHYRHSARKQINKALRVGLSARVAETWEEWEEYVRLYETRLKQWGKAATNRYSQAFFRTVYEARGPKVCLWVVEHRGRIAGGNLNFYQGRHCVEWHAAFDSSLFSCGVRDFLVDWIIRDARSRGFAWYDFNPSGGHEGTRRFKQTFGTVSQPSNLIICRRGIYRIESARRLLHTMRGLRQREAGRDGVETPVPVPR